MARFLASDDGNRDLICDDDHWSHFVDRSNSPGDYRFGRAHVRARTPLSRVSCYLTSMVEAIASSKLRRIERELELGGIGRRDRSYDS
jgi:hypothetical protein